MESTIEYLERKEREHKIKVEAFTTILRIILFGVFAFLAGMFYMGLRIVMIGNQNPIAIILSIAGLMITIPYAFVYFPKDEQILKLAERIKLREAEKNGKEKRI